MTSEAPDWDRKLYQAAPAISSAEIKLIPYCDWDNRKAGAMEVWLPTQPPVGKVGGPEVHAKVAISYLSGNSHLSGINDGVEPKSSAENPSNLTHFWPHKGTEEWVSYTWTKPVTLSGVKAYWFDDTGSGECRLPEAWHLEQLVDQKWVPIEVKSYPIAKDKYCEVSFAPIKVQSLRIVVKLQSGWAAGVRQLKVVEADE
jgi:hypothetical protein